MNTIKRTIPVFLLIIVAIALAGIGSSCKTSTTVTNGVTNIVTSVDWNRVDKTITAVLPPVLKFVDSKVPKSQVYLEDFATAVDTFATGNKLDPDSFTAALTSAHVRELNSDDAKQVALSLAGIYKLVFDEWISPQIDKSQAAQDAVGVLNAIAGAIRQAIPKPL